MARLLIIEDELPMRTALAETLQGHGYRVFTASDGPSGLARACEESPDLIVLDVMLPGLDGFALCRELRQRGRKIPVLMLTAKGLIDDRVQGLEAGADDYLVKPFAMRELIARVRALLRRVEKAGSVPDEVRLGAVCVDFRKRTCARQGKSVELSTKEFDMLRLLVEHAGQPVSREQFLDAVWEFNAYPTTRTVDNYIAQLRSKIETDPANPEIILTIRGIGYRLSHA